MGEEAGKRRDPSCLSALDRQIRTVKTVFRPWFTDVRIWLKESLSNLFANRKKVGHCLALLEEARTVQAVSGFQIGESLSRVNFLYIDDLVTDEAGRSHGLCQQLFDWIVFRQGE